MIIPSRPQPKFNLYKSTPEVIHGVHFYLQGRNALLDCLIRLNLKKGDAILLPSYMCFSSIKPILDYGFKAIYIEPNNDLSYDLELVKSFIEKRIEIKAILLVYYFGLSLEYKKIIDLSTSEGIKVIEDHCHSFLKEFKHFGLNSQVNAKIFSLRKSLPVRDGGVLLISENFNLNNGSTNCLGVFEEFFFYFSRKIEKLLSLININFYSKFFNRIFNLRSNKNRQEFLNYDPCLPSNALTNYLNDKNYLLNCESQIKANYLYLEKKINFLKIKIFRADLAAHSILQAFPLLDEKGGLCDYLRARGVGAWRWPDYELPECINNNSDFPIANLLNQQIVLLPIHQDIRIKDMQYMTRIIKDWIEL